MNLIKHISRIPSPTAKCNTSQLEVAAIRSHREAGSKTTKWSKVVEWVAMVSGGYLTACVAGDDWEVNLEGRKCELLRE